MCRHVAVKCKKVFKQMFDEIIQEGLLIAMYIAKTIGILITER